MGKSFENDCVFREIFFQRTVMSLLVAGALQPGHVSGILGTLKEFFVIFYWDDYRNGLAVSRDDFRLAVRTHVPELCASTKNPARMFASPRSGRMTIADRFIVGIVLRYKSADV